MSRFVRQSKVRHVFCQPEKPENHYLDLRLSSATGDHNYIKANTKFFAFPVSTAGGSLAVWDYEKTGKLPPVFPCLTGHKGKVLDFDFNPFHEHIIASGSDDCTVKVWGIPQGGVTEHIDDPLVNLSGHQRKVVCLRFNPTAEHVLASASSDTTVKIWDIEKGLARTDIADKHGQLIQDVVWSYDGSVLASSCKDKMLRLFDPRSGAEIASVQAHEGSKTSKLVYLGSRETLCSVGFTRQSKRQFKIWDPKNMSQPTATIDIDQAAGVLMPFYDEGTNLLYVAGKGDGNIRYFEMVDDKPWAFHVSEYRSSSSQKGVAMLPKRSVDTSKCEVTRFLKLTSRAVEPLSFIVPRKSDLFQADIFPDCYAGKAAMTADEFYAGTSKKPILMSMDPSKRSDGEQTAVKFNAPKSAAQLQQELDKANARIKELEAKLAAAGLS